MSYGASLKKKKREEEALTVMSHSKGYSTGQYHEEDQNQERSVGSEGQVLHDNSIREEMQHYRWKLDLTKEP